MGGWGVLDDPVYPNIPGTVNLNEEVDAAKLEDWEYEEPKKVGDIGTIEKFEDGEFYLISASSPTPTIRLT
jgi:hypothetical protein